MIINVLYELEKQIMIARPDYNRAQAFKLTNDLRILEACPDFGHNCEVEYNGNTPINPLASLQQIAKDLNPAMGPVRLRAQHMVDQLAALIPALEV